MLSDLDSAISNTSTSNNMGLVDLGSMVSAQPLIPQATSITPSPFSALPQALAPSQAPPTSVFDGLIGSQAGAGMGVYGAGTGTGAQTQVVTGE